MFLIIYIFFQFNFYSGIMIFEKLLLLFGLESICHGCGHYSGRWVAAIIFLFWSSITTGLLVTFTGTGNFLEFELAWVEQVQYMRVGTNSFACIRFSLLRCHLGIDLFKRDIHSYESWSHDWPGMDCVISPVYMVGGARQCCRQMCIRSEADSCPCVEFVHLWSILGV